MKNRKKGVEQSIVRRAFSQGRIKSAKKTLKRRVGVAAGQVRASAEAHKTASQPTLEPKYTPADLERELAREESGRHSNPGRTRRWNREHFERISTIRKHLIEQGDLPRPIKSPEMLEQERIEAELDRLYPNAESKLIVEYRGERWQRRYYPLSTSRSGKTVHAWGGSWVKMK
jgi:hypothetical protein